MDLSSFFRVPIGDLILWFVVFVFSLSFHEMAHAITSEWFGDDTGRLQGRISLNPMAHIDPLGTILFPLIGFINGGISLIGWAKPVETNPLRWRNKDMANIAVSAAGPISNMILATLAFIALKVMLVAGTVIPRTRDAGPFDLVVPAFNEAMQTGQVGLLKPIATMLSLALLLNLSLAVFNLIPIPPLDGSHVLETLLPPSLAETYARLQPYGFILLLGLFYLGVLSMVMDPVIMFVLRLL